MTASTTALLALGLGYLLGSIPFGLLLTRLGGAGNIRDIGSGNIGATNVLRTGRKDLAAATLSLDALKGAVAVWLGFSIFPEAGGLFGAVGAFVGHLYPVWLKGRGGKGVATMLGAVSALHWPSGLVFVIVWVVGMALTRFSSVGGVLAALAAPMTAALYNRFELVLLTLGMALLVLWKHRGNLERLLGGTEPRIGDAKGDKG